MTNKTTNNDTSKMIEALTQFGEAYVNLRDEWSRTDTCDLNDTTAIKHYPFDVSFDELNVLDWVVETIEELQKRLG